MSKKSLTLITSSIFLLLLSSLTQEAFSEPWISNRFAQNCASCHSPSRRNLSLTDRRCTLTCQGCHVNPNGGGIRNQYGVWNQQRWLKSMQPEKLAQALRTKNRPAPMKKQRYARQPKTISKRRLKKMGIYLKKGPTLVEDKSIHYNESDYDRSDLQEHITARSWPEFMERVTKVDPLRLERNTFFYGGGDLRIFYLSKFGPKKESAYFPMGFDFGARIRPIKRYLSFVVENRFFNTAGETPPDQLFMSSQVKSAYVLVDDMPFNTFAMYGLYRPLFGNYTADHENLFSRIVEFDYKTVYQAGTIGGSPNVPFVNLHIITPTASDLNKESGFAANLGGRFVTIGGSIMASYWDTKNDQGLSRKMYSLSGGFKLPFPWLFKSIIYTGDVTSFDIKDSGNAADTGSVMSNELKLQYWRENYLVVNYSNANVGTSNNPSFNRKNGNSSELMFGLKSFLLTGTEVEALYIMRKNKNLLENTNENDNIIQAQAHVFF